MPASFKGAKVRPGAALDPRRAPCVPAFCAIALGVATATAYAPPFWALFLITAITAGGAALTIRSVAISGAPVAPTAPATDQFYRWFWPLALLACLGAVRVYFATPYEANLPLLALDGRRVAFEGVIDDEPVMRPDVTVARLRLRWVRRIAGSASLDAEAMRGERLLIKLDPAARRWRFGDVLRVEGVAERPPRIDAFDYRLYLARKGIAVWVPRPDFVLHLAYAPPSALWERLYAFKDALRLAIERCVPAPESALLNGILIGDDKAMPAGLADDFRRTGTSHIISISGFNVGVIVGALVLLLGRIAHPRQYALLLIAVLWLYALFVGAAASIVRAVAMATVALTGQLLWRRGLTLNTLAAAACGMVLAQPFYLFDIGFQLSAAATLGLVLFAERLNTAANTTLARGAGNTPARLLRLLLDGVLLTCAAQLTTLPLLLAHFGEVSAVTLLSNALVLPLQPPIMGLGAFAGLVGVLDTDAGRIAALPVYALLRASTWLVRWTAAWPWASAPVPAIGWGGALTYAAVLCAVWGLLRQLRSGWRPCAGVARRAAVAVSLLTPLLGLAWLWSRPDGRLHVVLRGGSAYVRLPDGARVAVVGDGDLLGAILSDAPFWDRRVDVLMVPQLTPRAQAQALKILHSARVHAVLVPTAASARDTLFQFWRAAPYDAIAARAGDRFVLGAVLLDVQVLSYDQLENPVLGLWLESQQQRVLLWQAGPVGETALAHARTVTDLDLVFVQRGHGLAVWPASARVIVATGGTRGSGNARRDAAFIDLGLVAEVRAVSFAEKFIIYVEQSIDN